MEHTHLEKHGHVHGSNCGHIAIAEGDHIDYLHSGHLHAQQQDKYAEHVIEVSERNPDSCTPTMKSLGHDWNHEHGPYCGHEAVPHGEHMDYLVGGRLHHFHDDHCDDHGQISIL